MLIVFCLYQAIRWLKAQLIGSELLEERGRMILAGRVEENATGSSKEWPYTASEALDRLIAELKEARQERSRFDTFIRENTFLDQLTGSANRLLFDTKLESSLHESGASGAVFLLQINDWETIVESETLTSRDQLLVDTAAVIESLLERYSDAIQSRYYDDMFAVFIPNKGYKEVSQLLNQCLRSLDKIALLDSMDSDNWFHIGLTMYQQGEKKDRIVEEAELALKSAQHQSSNNWSRADKPQNSVEVRGNVRWRTLFDKKLIADKMELLAQPCYLDSQNNNRMQIHEELFVRISDEKGKTIKASRFIDAVSQVGYEMQLDTEVWKKLLTLLKNNKNKQLYSINLSTLPFRHHSHIIWFRDELMQLSNDKRVRLSFEFVESEVVQHIDFMRPVLKMLSAMSCKVIINQVGRTIVSTHYLNDVKVNYLKLHRSLIKRIENRPENQLYIRSLIGASSDTSVKVIAVGIETEKEWAMLLSLGVHGGQGRLFSAEHSIAKERKLASKPPKVTAGRRNRWR
jgi:RNase E specificity factor CsrD